jgi:arsenate reductase-like glutaredoxin family protein
MPVSIARKLQAFRDLFFPDLCFEVARVALTPEQVEAENLPSTPLKDTEKRASRWRDAFGIDQTEIDALTTPAKRNVLQQILRRAFKPYIDSTLSRRVAEAKTEWDTAAQEAVNDQIDTEHLARIRDEASTKLDELREQIDEITAQLDLVAGEHFTLPPIEVPEPEVELDPLRHVLVSFEDDWVSASQALIKHKAYGRD